MLSQVEHAGDRGSGLRDDRGERRAGDAHLKDQDEQAVKGDIDKGRDEQEVQGPPGIPMRPEDAVGHIVEELKYDPAGIDQEIGPAVRAHLLRGL